MKSRFNPLDIDHELDQVLYNFITLMQKKNQLDPKIDAHDLIKPLKEALLNAKDKNGLQINRDLFTSDAGIKKIMSLVIAASLQKQFANHPTLKNTFNVTKLALFLFDENQPEKDHQFIQNRILKLQAKYTPQSTSKNDKQNPEVKKQNNPATPEEDINQKALDFLYAEMEGQTSSGIIVAVFQKLTNSAGIVVKPGDKKGPGPGGFLEEEMDDDFKKHMEGFDDTAKEIFGMRDLFTAAPRLHPPQ